MAKVGYVSHRDIRGDFQLSTGRNVRTYISIAPVCRVSNIAEGQGRATKGEFIQFLSHARGSLFELETQLVVAGKLGYIALDRQQTLGSQTEEIARILNGLPTSLGVGTRKLSTIH